MSLDASMEHVFKNLTTWAGFPKYALERRLDIFLTPYLVDFLSREPEPSGDLSLVAPEFPILSEIIEVVGAPGQKPRKTLEDIEARTVNVDYLLYRGGPNPAWLLAELKTEDRSFKTLQLERYDAARRAGMPALLEHIRAPIMGKPGTSYHGKYFRLLKAIEDVQADPRAKIEIIYLAPSCPEGVIHAANWKVGMQQARFHALEDFGAMTPKEHLELWAHVGPLLRKLKRT